MNSSEVWSWLDVYVNKAIHSRDDRHVLIVRGVDEIPAKVKVRVQQLETGLFVHGSHKEVPFITDTHRAQLERRHAHSRAGGQDAVDTELRWWRRSRREQTRHGVQ